MSQVKFLKKAVPNISNTKKKLKELVVRAVYVEMLGQDASFAYIKAVELCASTNILHKRVGYLAASLCLSPEHEFRFMLVNQIQRDINRYIPYLEQSIRMHVRTVIPHDCLLHRTYCLSSLIATSIEKDESSSSSSITCRLMLIQY